MEVDGNKALVNWNQLVHHQFGHINKVIFNGDYIFILDNIGLYRVHVARHTLIRLDIPLGIDPLSIADMEIVNGTCYLAVNNGVTFFKSNIDIKSNEIPKVFMDKVTLNNELLNWQKDSVFDFFREKFQVLFSLIE